MRRAGVLAALLSLVPAAAQAGPWATGKGHFYLQLDASMIETDELATPDGTEIPIPTFERREVGVYALFGLSERLTLLVQGPLDRRSEIDDFGRTSGPGDARLGLQVQLGESGPWVFATRGILQAPTGDETRGQGVLPTGSGVWEGEVWLSAGRGWGQGWGFVEVGNLVRGEGLTDAFLHRTQVGFHAGRRVRLMANLWGVEPYDRRGVGSIGAVAGLGDGVRYLSYGPTVSFDVVPGWALELSAWDSSRQRNLASGVTYRLALAWSR